MFNGDRISEKKKFYFILSCFYRHQITKEFSSLKKNFFFNWLCLLFHNLHIAQRILSKVGIMINKKANILLFAWPYNDLLISFTDSHQDFMQII